MSIFPFLDPRQTAIPPREEPIMAREWAWDFKNDFKLKDGKMYKVSGKEAVKIWLWKIFQTPRYRYLIYTWDYGHELEGLVGAGHATGFIKSEAERLVKEAIWPTLDGYIKELKDLNVSFSGDVLTISFIAVTPYGEVEMKV